MIDTASGLQGNWLWLMIADMWLGLHGQLMEVGKNMIAWRSDSSFHRNYTGRYRCWKKIHFAVQHTRVKWTPPWYSFTFLLFTVSWQQKMANVQKQGNLTLSLSNRHINACLELVCAWYKMRWFIFSYHILQIIIPKWDHLKALASPLTKGWLILKSVVHITRSYFTKQLCYWRWSLCSWVLWFTLMKKHFFFSFFFLVMFPATLKPTCLPGSNKFWRTVAFFFSPWIYITFWNETLTSPGDRWSSQSRQW